MMILGVVISSKNNSDNPQLRYAFYAGAWVALASFMQPRYLLAGLVIFIIWALSFSSRKLGLTVASMAISVMLISPFALIARNVVAIDKASISTNLGVTMSIGAGDGTRGGYNRTGPEVPCSPEPPATSITDNQLVVCVLKWYVTNPTKTIKLAFFKSTYFWSPWSGPLENGTMLRNPWLKVAPTVNIAKTQSGAEFLNGSVAKLVSWGWILGQLALLFYGYLILFNGGAVSRVVANSTLSAIVISWLISIGTIGDHRFRIPTMGLSLLLQVAAIWKLKSLVSKAL
jgi:hypothetical protein